MIPTVNVGLDPARHTAWLQAYGERSLQMRTALAGFIFDTLRAQHQDIEQTRLALRAARPKLAHRFCLVLYGSGVDSATLDHLAAADPPLLDPAAATAARATARDPGRNALRVSELMTLLDGLCGAQVALLDRDCGDDVPPGPIRFPTPDAIWFESFAWIAELAWTIVVIPNTTANLVREMRHLDDVGLNRRTLLYAGDELLWWGERSGGEQHLRRWPLAVDSFAEAFEFAAAQEPPARPPG